LNKYYRTLFFLGAILFTFYSAFSKNAFENASAGVLNLSQNSIETINSISLNGEWLFFADTLIAPSNISSAIKKGLYKTIQVPSKRNETKNINFGTYYLKVILDSSDTEFTINTLTIYSAASIFVNGEYIGGIGKPGSTIKKTQAGLLLNTKNFKPKTENHIVIQYANFHREKDGIANNISLVTPKQKIKQASIRVIKYAIIIGTILFIIFNQINYFVVRRKSRTSFYFGIASIMISLYIVFMSFYYLGALLPDFNPNIEVVLRTWRIAYYMTVCFFALYIYRLFSSIYHKFILYFTLIYCSLSALLTLFTPLHISSINFNYFMYFTMFIGSHGVLMAIIGKIRGIHDSGLFLLGFGFFLTTVVNDILHNLLIIHSVNLLDVGIFGMMLTQAQIINSRLNRYLLRSEDLSSHLQFINANLENLVTERTEEIEEQKTEIEAQRDFAMSQHKLIARQKKTITDSINYAREIQQAVLPDEDILKQHFSDSFILFNPKDYVSGDFYWIRHFTINNTPHLIICAADCTGHGVPGALLSMLGMSLLSEIISHNQISKASEILEILREKFKETISNKNQRENSSDGMHITLCLINKVTNQLQYAGAFQALFHIRNNIIKKIKGTNCIIGNYMYEIPFENHIINLELNDRLYMFTDGFADQMAENGQGRFMQKRLLNLLTSFDGDSYKNQRNRLAQEFEAWKGNFDQIDDVLVMGVKV